MWSKLASRLRILRLLRTPADALLFGRMFVFALVSRALARLPLPVLAKLLEPARSGREPNLVRVAAIVRLIDPLIQFGRPAIRPGCLTRGLTLFYFLRRAGMDVSLDFGMGRIDAEYGGHCWLVSDGEPFLETVDPRPIFTHMYRIGPAAPPVERA